MGTKKCALGEEYIKYRDESLDEDFELETLSLFTGLWEKVPK